MKIWRLHCFLVSIFSFSLQMMIDVCVFMNEILVFVLNKNKWKKNVDYILNFDENYE